MAIFYIFTWVSISHLKYKLILLSSPTLSPPTYLPRLPYPSKWYYHPPSCSRYKSSLRSTLTHLLAFSQPSASLSISLSKDFWYHLHFFIPTLTVLLIIFQCLSTALELKSKVLHKVLCKSHLPLALFIS